MIKDYMTKKLIIAKQGTSFLDLINLMTTNRLSGIPIIDDENCLIGFAPSLKILEAILPSYIKHLSTAATGIYGKDFQSHIKNNYKELVNKTAADFMVKPSLVLNANSSFIEAIKVFVEKKINRIAVVDDDYKLVGVLCRNNLLLAIQNTLL